MNRKGQALVEFIIIVPIIVIILMGISDFVMIFSHKSSLDNNLSEVVKIYQKNNNTDEIDNYLKVSDNDIKYDIQNEGKYIKITLSKDYNFITPGLDKIISSPYIISAERVILSE